MQSRASLGGLNDMDHDRLDLPVTDPTAGDTARVAATACRVCAVGCGTLVELRGDTVVRVTGDPDDPWSQGYTCAFGRNAPTFHHHADRLDRPLVRRRGGLTATSWDDALDQIASATRGIVDRHGPNAVAHYTGTGGPLDPSGYAVAHGFFRALGTEQNYSALSVDCSGKFLVPELVAGVQLPFAPDLDECSLLVAISVNTVVSHGHGVMMPNPLGRLRELRARRARIVVIDPRRSETAHHADLHLAPRPGTDPALLAFLVRHVLRTGPDTTFLGACADAASVERLRRLVDPFTAVHAAGVCRVPVEQLEQLAAMVTAAGRVAIETGTGVSMGRSANLTEWLVWALSAVTGSLDRPGGARFNPGFLRPIEDALPGGRGDLRPGPASRPDLPRIVNGEMPCAALPDEIEAGTLKALFVRVGNPAQAIPDTARMRRALASLELLVVIDARGTATTQQATHVLPMADHFERGDVLTGYLQAKPFLRYAPPVVAPRAERRPQWWIFAELGRRLGLPLFGRARVATQLADRPLDDEIVAATLARSARRPWAEVLAAPYGVLDDCLAPGWMIPARLPRPLDVAPAELAELFSAAWPDRLPPADELVLVNRRTGKQYNSFTPTLVEVEPTLLVHPTDAWRLGLRHGARATVTTPRGSCDALVEVTDAIAAGVVSLPHASTITNVNELTSTDDADPLNGMPLLSGFAVTVAPALRTARR